MQLPTVKRIGLFTFEGRTHLLGRVIVTALTRAAAAKRIHGYEMRARKHMKARRPVPRKVIASGVWCHQPSNTATCCCRSDLCETR